MYIEDLKTGEKIEVTIVRVSARDFQIIKKDSDFKFDWNRYKNGEVYKLRAVNEEKIQGLMSIIDHTDEQTNAIEIELLEVREENVGEKKKLDRIAGTLIAYACRESFKRKHEGYFFLIPKSKLINHYSRKYYLSFTGPIGTNLAGLMVGEEKIARKLIKEYLE